MRRPTARLSGVAPTSEAFSVGVGGWAAAAT